MARFDPTHFEYMASEGPQCNRNRVNAWWRYGKVKVMKQSGDYFLPKGWPELDWQNPKDAGYPNGVYFGA